MKSQLDIPAQHAAEARRPTAQVSLQDLSADPVRAAAERWMETARPRLLRFARSRGIAPDAVEDVAQETLMEAWRRINTLTAPSGFDAWLNVICHNVCRRYVRADSLRAQRRAIMSRIVTDENGDGPEFAAELDVPDPFSIDPAQESERQDLAALLDRALGHLPESARQAVELFHLAELPQREIAFRLGLTIRALETRLHRARKQLRGVLSGELRAEAQAFDLAVDGSMPAGWRETRIWCWECGHQRMHGMFEPLSDGRVNLVMRCPGCLRRFATHGVVPLNGLRSFRPAHKRLTRFLTTYLTEGVRNGWQTCVFCGTRQLVWIAEPEALGDHRGRWPGMRALLRCATCGEHIDSPVGILVQPHPEVQRFIARHPRWLMQPEILMDYMGSQTICVRLADFASSAHLTVFTHPQTLQVLATSQS